MKNIIGLTSSPSYWVVQVAGGYMRGCDVLKWRAVRMIRMLKLVISNEIAQVQPSAVPQVGKFRAGEVLECRASKERVLVIGCDKQGSAAVLMPLPDGELYETRIEDMKGWESSYLAGPRLVELCRKSSDKVEWSCYMPNFDTALALWQKVDAV